MLTLRCDWSLVEEYASRLQRAMDWLSAHDSNDCGMLEIPEAGTGPTFLPAVTTFFYDEVLWQRCLIAYSDILRHLGDEKRSGDYNKWSAHVRKVILRNFWPSTSPEATEGLPSFSDVQFALGDTRYLVAQISPFNFSWRCDVYGNLLAYIMNLVDKERAMMTFRFMWVWGSMSRGR